MRAVPQISWTLTTQASTIIDFLLTGHPASLQAMADAANPHLPAWAAGYLSQGKPLANILIIDHYCSCSCGGCSTIVD